MGPRISIITISFNSEKTIEKTFESVLRQSYENIEYVLVDGGSTDSTNEIIARYIPKFNAKGIVVNYKSEPDKGISDAFNKGISRATGEIIGIINSDDCLAENALNIVAASFDTETDVVYGDCLWKDEIHEFTYVRKSKGNLKRLKFDMVIMHPTCFVRKSAYEKYGVFDIQYKYVMDKELMARFYRKGAKFKYIPEIIAEMSAGGVSDANSIRVFKEGIEVAVQNGVPRWKVGLIFSYKRIRLALIDALRQNRILWQVIKNFKNRLGQ